MKMSIIQGSQQSLFLSKEIVSGLSPRSFDAPALQQKEKTLRPSCFFLFFVYFVWRFLGVVFVDRSILKQARLPKSGLLRCSVWQTVFQTEQKQRAFSFSLLGEGQAKLVVVGCFVCVWICIYGFSTGFQTLQNAQFFKNFLQEVIF